MPDHLSSQLEELVLMDGRLSGSQLIRFVAGPDSPRLKTLELNDIQHLQNRDIFMVLFLVAPTLTEFHLVNCFIPYQNLPEGEELALDEAMPHLKALRFCMVGIDSAPLVTPLGISRKTSSLKGLGTEPPSTIIIFSAREEYMALHKVGDALNITGWDKVYISWHEQTLDKELLEKAMATSVKRGIKFSPSLCHY
ncbi:hypothetical protein C0991_009564 [Blastosporella zonata]|nr:hypothetical protein C0991_009564 [Blastosporella zonata]